MSLCQLPLGCSREDHIVGQLPLGCSREDYRVCRATYLYTLEGGHLDIAMEDVHHIF